MGKVKGTWLLPGHSGRANKSQGIYTRMDKKTGAVYSAELRNPYTGDPSEKQTKQRNAFSTISKGISAWIADNEPTKTDPATPAYIQLKELFDKQYKYSTIRGFMMAKGYATISESNPKNVLIKFAGVSETVELD